MKILRTLLNVRCATMIMLIMMPNLEILVILLEYIEALHIEIVNYKIPIVFHRLKNHGSHLVMQELCKFSLKINVIQNKLEKYMSYTVNNK